eukprot:g5334.t1
MWSENKNRQNFIKLKGDINKAGNACLQWVKGFESTAQSALTCLKSMQEDLSQALIKNERSASKFVNEVRRNISSTFQRCTSQQRPPFLRSAAFASLSAQVQDEELEPKIEFKTSEHIKKLRHVRVFMLLKNNGTPVFHTSQTRSKKAPKKVGLAFFNYEDAEQLLKKMRAEDSKAYSSAFVKGLPLSFFFEDYIDKERKDNKNVTYQFVPDSDDIAAAQKIIESDATISGCPLFVCDSIRDCDDSIPCFFSYSDLQQVMDVSLKTAISKETAALQERAKAFQTQAQYIRKEAKKYSDIRQSELEEQAYAAEKESEMALERIQNLPEELKGEMVPKVENLETFLQQFESDLPPDKNKTLVAPNSIVPVLRGQKYALEKKQKRLYKFQTT